MARIESLAREWEGGLVRLDGGGKEEVGVGVGVGVDQQKQYKSFADVRAEEVEAAAMEVQLSKSLRKRCSLV